MMKAFLKIKSPYLRPDGMGKRHWAKVTQTCHADMAEFWHKRILPRHFTPFAKHRYQHRPRSKKYLGRKRALAARGIVQMGGEVDNVFTGAMMRQLVGANTIRAYPTRATLTMFGPRYVTMRVFKANQPDKAAEITRTRDDELKMIAEVADRSITRSTKNDNLPPLTVNP